MKKTSAFFLALMYLSLGYGQSLSPEVVASGGDHFTGGDVQLSWTTGELMVDHYDDGAIILSQGFHQSNLLITSIEAPIEGIAVRAYPNPVANELTIECQDVRETLSIILYDQKGTQLLAEKIIHQDGLTKTILDLTAFPSSIYFLHISDEQNKMIKNYKILKNK
ncbi:MAG: hypothetical protein ACI8YQ_002943 [Polaribacter sp.]|jgi:hypothetical protein